MTNNTMKLLEEFNRYFTSGNDVDVPARISVSRDEWRQLYKSLKEQNTQPADVTDEQILEATLHIPYPREEAFPDEWQQYEIAVARAVLALRPVQAQQPSGTNWHAHYAADLLALMKEFNAEAQNLQQTLEAIGDACKAGVPQSAPSKFVASHTKAAYDEAPPEARTDFVNGIRWGEHFHSITAQCVNTTKKEGA